MKVLLSIKPEFAEMIFNGIKKFEFRRSIFKNKNIKTIVVYASSPVQKVIGEFEIETILLNDPVSIWEQTKDHAGITREYYFKYFSDTDKAYAIQIKNTKKYRKNLCLRRDFNLTPPQSFMYLENAHI